MDKKGFIGLILIFIVMMGYAYFTSPSMEEKEAAKQAEQEAQLSQMEQDALNAAKENEREKKDLESRLADSSNPFFLSLTGNEEIFRIENELSSYSFSTKGGRLSNINLKEYLSYSQDSIYLLKNNLSEFYLEFFAKNRLVNTSNLYFDAILPERNKVEGSDSASISMRLYAQNNLEKDSTKYIEWVYTIYGNNYKIGLKLNMVGLSDIISANTNFIDLCWRDKLESLEKSNKMEEMNTALFYKPINDKVDNISEGKDDKKELNFPCKWIGFKQQFFSCVLIAEEEFKTAEVAHSNLSKNDPRYLKAMSANIGLPYNNSGFESFEMSLYAGPNKYNLLKDYNLDLERLIPLGWGFFLLHWVNRFAVIPVFDFLEGSGINYGIIILILTILIKLILSPITYKSYISSAKMRVIQPEVEEINKKYPKQEQAMDKQRAVMALYKKAGISPMAGCIPMLLQFPILIAMFRFFPASIELRQQSFLWADDLSAYDSIWNMPFSIPFYGNHVSLFALLMAATNLLYTRMTMKQSAGGNQLPGMKFMMYFMPIMFLGLLNSYSSALNYYYCISTLLTFLIMWVIRKGVDDQKVWAKIQEHKKKPVKKSKFQQRLEAMAKQQQEMLKQQRQYQNKK